MWFASSPLQRFQENLAWICAAIAIRPQNAWLGDGEDFDGFKPVVVLEGLPGDIGGVIGGVVDLLECFETSQQPYHRCPSLCNEWITTILNISAISSL